MGRRASAEISLVLKTQTFPFEENAGECWRKVAGFFLQVIDTYLR